MYVPTHILVHLKFKGIEESKFNIKPNFNENNSYLRI